MSRGLWAERLSRPNLRRLALGLAVGATGGFLADLAGVPLAWMLGPIFLCMAASLAGAPVDVPVWLRMAFMSVIGLFLGESFSHASAEDLARWPVTLLAAVLYVPVAGGLCYAMFRWLSRMDAATALLTSLPGGLTAVALFAGEIGTDERRVALYHALRVAFVVLAAPAVAFGWLGLPHPQAGMHGAGGLIGAADFALLAGLSVPAVWMFRRMGWPVPYLLGPLAASAALRFPGVIEGALPGWLVELSLMVAGASIGTRFRGAPMRFFAETAGWTLLGTVVLLALSGVFAVAMSWLTGVDLFAALLAYAPGGVAEMSLIAIAIDADPAFVATHHLARIVAVLAALPLLGGLIRRLVAADRAARGCPEESRQPPEAP
ncbi:MAG: AbrB family transcriptional regulator [Pseudomonadota bacterium]